MSVILAMLIVFGLLVLAVKVWKKSKILSLGLTVPFFLVLFFIGYVVYNSWYHTTPDSLKVTVQKEKQRYTFSGVWVKQLDKYRFVTDYIVIYVPYNTEVSNVKRNRYKNYNEMNDGELEAAARNSIQDEISSELHPYIFDIEATKEFTVSFDLPENLNPKDIKAYYVHIREEPMSSLEFWFKKIRIS
jgi:energy-coupling factor transporter transmembrane protein EcfT